MKRIKKAIANITLVLISLLLTGCRCSTSSPDPEIIGPTYPGLDETVYTDAVQLKWDNRHDDYRYVKCFVYFGTDPDVGAARDLVEQ